MSQAAVKKMIADAEEELSQFMHKGEMPPKLPIVD